MRIGLKSSIICLCLTVIMLGCGNNSTKPVEQTTRLYFTPEDVAVTISEQAYVTLAVSGLSEYIFGLSCQMVYDSTIISFSDTLEVEAGAYFGQDAISFIRNTNSIIHMSITRIQGQESVSGSGDICIFPITGKAVGECSIQILMNEVHFYNSAGDEIEILEQEFESAQISVR